MTRDCMAEQWNTWIPNKYMIFCFTSNLFQLLISPNQFSTFMILRREFSKKKQMKKRNERNRPCSFPLFMSVVFRSFTVINIAWIRQLIVYIYNWNALLTMMPSTFLSMYSHSSFCGLLFSDVIFDIFYSSMIQVCVCVISAFKCIMWK